MDAMPALRTSLTACDLGLRRTPEPLTIHRWPRSACVPTNETALAVAGFRPIGQANRRRWQRVVIRVKKK